MTINTPEQSQLGKAVAYEDQYNPNLLFQIPRLSKRQEIAIEGDWPFFGEDLWTAYEVSWLMPGGKPQVAIVEFIIPASSLYLVESKSIKLYLNSFNQTVFASWQQVQETISKDLSHYAQAPVTVQLFRLQDYLQARPFTAFAAESIDDEVVEISNYHTNNDLLKVTNEIVTESLCSDLLKSNCLVTGQPDWGSVCINYSGAKLDRKALLCYLVGFRQHNEFHEQCVERIFMDILRECKPTELTVYARYTRRGGLDINPIRSTAPIKAPLLRLVRQ